MYRLQIELTLDGSDLIQNWNATTKASFRYKEWFSDHDLTMLRGIKTNSGSLMMMMMEDTYNYRQLRHKASGVRTF